MEKSLLKGKIKDLPRRPGVYLFKDEKNEIIYVGKAKRLRDRVNSYFSISPLESSKTRALVRNISDVSVIEVKSEFEAIILEAELIKLHKPKYNIRLKDDKSLLYIAIRNEELRVRKEKSDEEVFLNVSIPKITLLRETDLKKGDISFGPFPQSSVAKYIIRAIRKIVPYRDCSKTKFVRCQKEGKYCLYGDLGLCSAPCTKKISIKDYKKDIEKIKKILRGQSPKLIESIKHEMISLSKEQKYEQAGKKRDFLEKINYVTKSFYNPQKYINSPHLFEDLINEALTKLKDNISIINRKPGRIEGYDISNLSGKQATGSMVVFENGRAKKSEYRKFKIKFSDTPNDVAMMGEVLGRRFGREQESKKSSWGMPDLVLVDGGKGQVSMACSVLQSYGLKVPVVGLAKKDEVVIYKDGPVFKKVKFPKNSQALKLLQQIRDESHRFAKNYHKYLRLKSLKDVL